MSPILITLLAEYTKEFTGLGHLSKNILATVGTRIGVFAQLGDTVKTFYPGTDEALM